MHCEYLIIIDTKLREFDRNVPINVIKKSLKEADFKNLQFIIRTELTPENFYCGALNETLSGIKTFLCIDKNDKDLIFLSEKQE